MGILIVGTGYRLGARHVSNGFVAQCCNIEEDEILRKTGIESRWYQGERETLLDLAATAAQESLVNAIDGPSFLACATFAHDVIYPSLASRISTRLQLRIPQLYDIQSNCTGFLNALLASHDRMSADSTVGSGLVVAAESNSPFIGTGDPAAMMFWSDGAGAVSLLKEKQSTSGLKGRAHLSSTQSNMAVRLVWRSTHGADGSLLGRQTEPVEMGGLATWREATSGVPEVVRGALVNAGAKLDDIDYFIFHQANLRMIEYLTKKLRLNEDRVLTNVAEVGNLGAASIPVMLAQANQNGVLCRGDKILMVAVGAGFTFVALVWEW